MRPLRLHLKGKAYEMAISLHVHLILPRLVDGNLIDPEPIISGDVLDEGGLGNLFEEPTQRIQINGSPLQASPSNINSSQPVHGVEQNNYDVYREYPTR